MFILLGLNVGLVAADPMGPINVFVVSQTLKRDFFHGLLAGLTAILLDVTFCFVALAGFCRLLESRAHPFFILAYRFTVQ